MALITADRVLETSTTVGTGAYTLAGAVTGYRAASTVCVNASTFAYYAEAVDASGVPTGDWETGLGTWGTGGILTRTTVDASSNANAAVSWAAGTKRIALGLTAKRMQAIGFNSSGQGSQAVIGAGAMALGGSYASGTDSFAAAIGNNTSSYGALGANSIAMGKQAKVTGSGSLAILEGALASGNSALAIGTSTTASGSASVALGGGGSGLTSDGTYSLAFGASAKTNGITGKEVTASGQFTAQGDAQRGGITLRRSTTNATATVITSDNGAASTTNQVILTNNQAMTFEALITARQNTTGDTASWNVSGCIKRGADAAATSLVGTIVSLASAADTGAALWTAVLSADTVNGGLKITVTGEAAKTIRWSATVFTNELAG